MKKTTLLNSDISYLIASMGHQDKLVICDSGLPIPKGVEKIDLALVNGVPSFIETLESILSELCIEEVIVSNDFVANKGLFERFTNVIQTTDVQSVSHEEFKELVKDAMAVIRTGEHTPYANVILKSGVVF